MSCKYIYNGVEYTENELIIELAKDPSIVNKYKAQEQRVTSDDFQEESMNDFNEKVETLQKTMNVEVIIDPDVETSRVLGKNDPRTKAAGKPVILINPNAVFKTTAIHEFGHIFIDSFPGGLNNPRIQKALEQLKGTELEAQVKAAYPDLSPDMLAKEILVTAIGIEGSKLWADGRDASTWESFIAWFTDFIKRTFGLPRNEVIELSKELLNNKVKDVSHTKLEETAQESRKFKLKTKAKKTDEEKSFEKSSTKIERIHGELLGTIQKIFLRQKAKVTESKSARKAEKRKLKKYKTTRFSSIKELKEEMDKFEDVDKMLGVTKYLEWANKELNFMDGEINKRISEKEFTDTKIQKSFDWSQSFSIIDDIKQMLKEVPESDFKTKADLKAIEDRIDSLNSKRKNIHANLLKMAKSIYIQKMIETDTYVESKYKEKFRKEWQELNAIGDPDLQEGEYIIQKLQEFKDDIDYENEVRAENFADRAETILGKISMNIVSETNMRSEDIRLIHNILNEVSHENEVFSTEESTNQSALHEVFMKSGVSEVNSRDMRKKYKNMFTFSKSGQGYFTSAYLPEYLEERRDRESEAYNKDLADEKFGKIEIKVKTDSKGKKTYYYESELKHPVTGKKHKGVLKFYGAKNIVVEGHESLKDGERAINVSYDYDGEKRTISLNEAIGRSELDAWTKLNSRLVEGSLGTKVKVPTANWENPAYKELKEDKVRYDELQKLLAQVNENNLRYDDRKSLITKVHGLSTTYVRLPGVMKSTASRVVEGQSPKTLGKHILSTMVQRQEDDFDEQTVENYSNFDDGESFGIPVSFRAKLKESDQSLDLHTLVLMDTIMSGNFNSKSKAESTLMIIQEVMKEKRYPRLDPRTGKQVIDAEAKDPKFFKGGMNSQEYKKAQSMIENRLYGVTSKQSGSFEVGKEGNKKTVEVQKIAQTTMKVFGGISLIGNYMNSIINAGTGTLNNLIEAVGGDVYNMSDYRRAQKYYRKDLINIVKDWTSPVATSNTNLLLNYFNVMGPEYLQKNFEKGGKAEAMAAQSTLRPLAKAGEHAMQSKVMYAILESIKSQNEKGQWINAEGKVVKSKKEAASLTEMITFKENAFGGKEMVLNDLVENTSFSTGRDNILLETRNLIRVKIDDLHGQYTEDIQAHAQRYAIGKLGFFLRKWMVPGYMRRYRGIKNIRKSLSDELKEDEKFYSSGEKSELEGYYVTAVRFLAKVAKDTREDSFNIIKTAGNAWGEITPKQRAGIKKTMVDFALMGLVWALSSALDADDEDDEIIKSRYAIRRQLSELTTFANPIEALKIASTPTAAVGNLKQISKLIYQMGDPMERYKVGEYKDELKVLHAARKVLPRIKNDEDFKQGLDFMNTFTGN
jgi:hypothetical protein